MKFKLSGIPLDDQAPASTPQETSIMAQPGQAFYAGTGQPVPEETGLQKAKRYGTQALSGALESTLGFPFGSAEVLTSLGHQFVTGKRLPFTEETHPALGYLPTPGNIEKFIASKTGGANIPQTPGEEDWKSVISIMSGMKGPIKSAKAVINAPGTAKELLTPAGISGLAKSAGTAYFSNELRKAIKDSGGSPIQQAIGQVSFMALANSPRVIQEAERMNPVLWNQVDELGAGANTNVAGVSEKLHRLAKINEGHPEAEFYKQQAKAFDNLTESPLLQEAGSIKAQSRRVTPENVGTPPTRFRENFSLEPITKNTASVNDLTNFVKNTNAHFDPYKPQLNSAIEKVKNIVNPALNEYGSTNPEWMSAYDAALNNHRLITNKSGLTKTLENVLSFKPNLETQLSKALLFGTSALFGQSFPAIAKTFGAVYPAHALSRAYDFLSASPQTATTYIKFFDLAEAGKYAAASQVAKEVDKDAKKFLKKHPDVAFQFTD